MSQIDVDKIYTILLEHSKTLAAIGQRLDDRKVLILDMHQDIEMLKQKSANISGAWIAVCSIGGAFGALGTWFITWMTMR
jgi:hypothetical protein